MRYAKIGGQAVMEGIMMRCGEDYAVAVRMPDNSIMLKKDKCNSLVERWHMKNVPIIRGMLSFVDSTVLGVSTLTYSASFFDEEGSPETEKLQEEKDDSLKQRTEESDPLQAVQTQQTEYLRNSKSCTEKSESSKPVHIDELQKASAEKSQGKIVLDQTEKKKEALESLMMAGAVVVSIGISVLLFMLTPFFISSLAGRFIQSPVVIAIMEGVLRIVIFLGYMVLVSRMEEIQRVFAYHGAEHKTITCIEQGMELTPENAMKCSRLHKRCGTSFLLIVMIITVICFIFIRVEGILKKLAVRLVLIPIIAGVSFELIQWTGRHQGKLVDLISTPGLWLQKLTTREPDEEMLEVAIAAIEAIYDWRAFQEGDDTLAADECCDSSQKAST